jgi:hypothetical protein
MTSTYTAAASFAASIVVSAAAHAQPAAVLKFWNLSSSRIIELSVAPPETSHWSQNLCLSDPDHSVDPDERLAMVGVKSGTYDVRVVDVDKRACVFHKVTISAAGPYALAISESELKTCKRT